MKIAILTVGTRGDVQPYIALGKGLKARGHEVLLAAPDDFTSWVEEHGLRFRPMGVDVQGFLQSPEGRAILRGNVFALAKIMRSKILPLMRATLEATWEAGREAEVIIFHPKANAAVDVAQATKASAICAAPLPMFPTRAFPFMLLRGNYGSFLNWLSYKPLNLSRAPFIRMYNRWRREMLGLDKGPVFMPMGGLAGGEAPSLFAASPAVLDYPPDKDATVISTGYWFLDEGQDWQPDPELQAFLEAGEPPVYIGFGSMASKNSARVTREVVKAVGLAGVRAILATGWGGMSDMQVPANLHVIKAAPHDALFRRVNAVVHHGGAGTTGAGLRAGRPTLICPLAFDQPFWGRRVHALGCGPKPQTIRRLKAERFAQGLVELTQTESYGERAGEIADAIAMEDGVARAIEVIEGLRP